MIPCIIEGIGKIIVANKIIKSSIKSNSNDFFFNNYTFLSILELYCYVWPN